MKISIFFLFCLFLLPLNLVKAIEPYWWSEYGLIKGNDPKSNTQATVGQLKHCLDKTIIYLDEALANAGGAGVELTALRTQKWFTNTENDNSKLSFGQLRSAMAPVYDRLKEAHPSEYKLEYNKGKKEPNKEPDKKLNVGWDKGWNTRWMMDPSSPFYSDKELQVAKTLPIKSLAGDNAEDGNYRDGSHYPWTKEMEDNMDSTLVTYGQLKYTCYFETPASIDTGEVKKYVYFGSKKLVREYIPKNIQADESLPLYINLSGSNGGGEDSVAWCSQGQNRAYALHIDSLSWNHFSTVAEVIDSFIKKHQVDSKRIYFIGYSLGGGLLMDFLDKRPDLVTVAWFIESANPDLFSSPDHPLHETTTNWTSLSATNRQKAFADKIAANKITVIFSAAQLPRRDSSIITFQQTLEYYRLFHSRGVSVFYSSLPGWHGLSKIFANNDYRYHRFISSRSKN